MSNYVCSYCGAAAYYDGRCGDGPVLMCGCDKRRRSRDAKPTESENYSSDEDWDNRDPEFNYADRH
jgi:hypothetical protein